MVVAPWVEWDWHLVWDQDKGVRRNRNINPNCDSKAWLQKYIYTNVYEVFFATFPLELHSWLTRLANCIGHVQSDRVAQWNQVAVQRLKNTNNIVSRAVDFWFTSLLSGFIAEFVVDRVKAYSEAKRQYFKGYRGKFLNYLNLWINMLLCDKWVLQLRSDL